MPLRNLIRERMKRFVMATSRSNVLAVTVMILLLITIGTIAYALFEGWSLLDSLYATIITITTVGYGDFSPKTPAGRSFAIVFTLGAIGIGGYAISELAAFVIEHQADRRERILRRVQMNTIAALHAHVIVCGLDTVGRNVAKEYQRTNVPYLLIDPDEEKLKRTLLYLHDEYFRRRILANLVGFSRHEGEQEAMSVAELADELGVAYIHDDPKNDEVLLKAGIDRARALVTVLPDDRDNLFVVVGARALSERQGNSGMRIMARASTAQNVRKLYLAGADHVRSPAVIGGYHIASAVINPGVNEFLDRMLLMDTSEEVIRYRDIAVAEYPMLEGKPASFLADSHRQIVLGLRRDEKFIYNPAREEVLQAKDIVFTLGPEFVL